MSEAPYTACSIDSVELLLDCVADARAGTIEAGFRTCAH